jgi:phosphatidylserine decarboxylase
MRRNFSPSPMALALPLLRWMALFAIVGAAGRFWTLFWAALALGTFHAAFHRNTRRHPPSDPSTLVSPAFGHVADISEVEEPSFLKGRALRIGIFLSVFDTHTQPAPCDARLVRVDYRPGKFLDARDAHASDRNESQFLGLETPDGRRLAVRQIAGLIARRIVLWRLVDEEVRAGELLGMIRYGSRVELYLPAGKATALVKVGDRVRGGTTPIAAWSRDAKA